MAKLRELRRVSDDPQDAERLEHEILALLRREVFSPLLKLLKEPATALQNARHTPLTEAIRLGKVIFRRGVFSGDFTASVSRELKALGAVWDKATSTWRLQKRNLPTETQDAIAKSEARMADQLKRLDAALVTTHQKLTDFPSKIAESLRISEIFDTSLWKTERGVAQSLKGLAIPPDMTPERRRRIADEWRDNLALPIKDFATKEVERLRDMVQKHAFKGGRYEDLVGGIRRQYGVTQSKARFWAQQETSLLVTKFKETRYTDAGITHYIWRTVKGSAAHPVRPAHKALEGKIFRWDDPPITTEPGEPERRNNPGQDFRCRCFAIPLLKEPS